MPSPVGRQLQVGDNFRSEIAKANLSRTDAAELFSVCEATITAWCRRGVSTRDKAIEVAEILSVPVSFIHTKTVWSKRKVKPAKDPASWDQPTRGKPNPKPVAVLRPELLIRLASTPLTDDQAELLEAIIQSYGAAS